MIVSYSKLLELRKTLHGKKIVFAGGTFDLFHRGHIESFKNLHKFGDIVVIAVSTDTRVRQRKGPNRPILPQKERLALVDSIRYVDYSLIAPEPSKNSPVPTLRILRALRPDVFVSTDKRWLQYLEKVELCGTQMKIIPRGNINSTTRLITTILKRYRVHQKKQS